MSEEEKIEARVDQREFKTLLEVTEWLDGEGWKISKSALHRHHRSGRLRPDENGCYPRAAVEKYAISWLKKKTDAEKVKAEKLAEEERKERIGYQAALRKKMELQHAILDGRYVLKDQVYLELASRAAVLDSGIKAVIQLRAEEWLAAAGGDPAKIANLIRAVLHDMEELVNNFSTTRQFHVLFKHEDADSGSEEDGKQGNE